MLAANVKRIEPVLTVADRVTAHLEESRLLVDHSTVLTVEKAGIYAVEFTPQTNFVVAAVNGDGVEDWKVADGKLRVSFASRVLGTRQLEVQLEQALKILPDQIAIAPLRATGATLETAQVGAAAAPGLRVKTSEMTGLREIPIARLTARTDELLAFTSAQADWNLILSTERLPARIGADIFNLITIGDGVVGGSATIRYDLVNQGVQEFHLKLPSDWKNIEFTGVNIRSRERAGEDWTIHLQEKAWDGYTLVVTYDKQFDATNATLDASGPHAPEAEHETGSVAVTTAASIKVQSGPVADPLRVIDQTELAESDRALITRPVLLAYRYTGHSYELKLDVARQQEAPVLDAVADRTQLTSVLTDSGEMLTQASFMVKNNGKQFQRFQLPPDARFWGCSVDGITSKAGQDNGWLLVSLPERADRDQAFAVDIVYAQDASSVKSRWLPVNVALQAPKTDLPNTFAEWELFAPENCHVSSFGGTMTVMRGTTYNLHDALSRFTEFYSDVWAEHAGGLIGTFVAGLVILLVVIGSKTPRRSLIEVLAVLAIFAILAGMMLPALAKAKQKATRISAVNNLKQIGIALRIFADENNTNRLPIHLEDARNEYGQSDKLLVDPESGERFIYVGAGKTLGDPNVIIAFSPYGQHGRAVLLGDGSVQQMSSVQFAEAERREEAAHFANPPPPVVMSSEPPASRPAFQNKPEGMANGAVQPASAAVAPEAVPAMSAAGALETMQPVNEAVATAAMPAPTPPTAAGLRSIHIDIPRLGQPFTFTKVLNTGGEPLTIKMSVMNSVIFAIIRSGLQTAVFLCGLLLVWWQCRHNRSSLMITLGAALAIGSVGALLISGRVLHLAFIAAVPLVMPAPRCRLK